MGMNYYVKISEPHKCASCSKRHICEKTVHIGKSSYGYHFRFAYNKGKYYKNINQLKRFIKKCKVVYDEDDCVRDGEMLIDGSIFINGDFF